MFLWARGQNFAPVPLYTPKEEQTKIALNPPKGGRGAYGGDKPSA